MASSSTSALSLGFVWGANAGREGLQTSIHFQDEHTVVYAAGHAVVLYNTSDKSQKFIGGATDDAGFSAMAICPSKRFLAVAEIAERASILVYDLKTLRKRKILQQTTVACSKYASVCFSNDNETLVALVAGPGPPTPSPAGTTSPTQQQQQHQQQQQQQPGMGAMLLAWRWSKGKVSAQLVLADKPSTANFMFFFDCAFSHLDSVVAVCGTSSVVFARVQAEEMSPMPSSRLDLEDGVAMRCLCWLKQAEDYCIAGLTSGGIVLFQACNYLCHLNASLQHDATAPRDARRRRGVASVVAVTNGFVAGSTTGTFHLFTLTSSSNPADLFSITHVFGDVVPAEVAATPPADDKQRQQHDESPSTTTAKTAQQQQQQQRQQQQQQAPKHHHTTANGIAPPREILAMDVRPNSENLLVAVTSDKQVVRMALNDANVKTDVEPLHCGFHGPGIVTGLDVCVRKPLVVTTSLDKTLRVWNLATHEAELCKHYAEDPFSVSFHPSGLHVIVGFSDKLRLINLLVDDARVSREVPIKACRECHFSNGGQYFAAVNGSVISVYEFYTCDKLIDLRGHNSKVRSLYWGKDDHFLVSCGQDGAVYQWEWYDGKRSGEFVQKGTVYNSALCTSMAVFAVGSDHMMKELEVPELQPVKQLDGGATLNQIALSSIEHFMFASTAEEGRPGCVRAYPFPLSGDFLEYACAGAPITRLRITHDDARVVVASEDGGVYAFDVRDRHERQQRDQQAMQAMAWSEEILVTKSDLEEKNLAMQELKNKIEELQLHNEYQLRLKEMSYGEKIKEVTEKYMQDLEQEKNKFDLLREEKNDIEMECDERYRQMEDGHHHEIQELENKYQQRIMAEVERFQQLENERDLQKQRWDQQRSQLVEAHRAYLAELTDDFEQKLEEDREHSLKLREEKEELDKEFHETKSQLEDDIDTEIQNLRHRYDAQLAAEREATLRYKGENGIMKKKFAVLTKDIEDQKEEVKSLLAREKDLHEQIKKLEREITAHKIEIKKRDDTIGVKEKKIYELKKKNQELEKFKFVLDYKIKELKRQIEPRETEIANMKAQIKTMDHELEQYHKSNAQLDLMIGELRAKLDSMQKEILERRKHISDREAVIRRFKADVHECVQHIQNPPKLREAVEALHQRHQHKVAECKDLDSDVVSEYKRHEASLKRTLATLQQQFQADMANHSADNMRFMSNNMSLIREINKQREANRILKLAVQADEARVANDIAMRQCNKTAADDKFVLSEAQLKLQGLQRHVDDLEQRLQERGLGTFDLMEIPFNDEDDPHGFRPPPDAIHADPPAPGLPMTS
ncbi:hypothetical protein CTAYLR_010208 [Chrysophaeum taylorii]|uniref:Uncharacterized protein n=1 Tax=Chrysophaeum taylorii TaxID=2483200 RepID=A0AAD7UJ60_9STRA|nr:hypothetical protein CTAYLR_010208 [Chrysophaeum taylorii]